ncbi:putative ATP-grasp domain-containing protein [Seiridium cardinale]|uniref:ATP-grasp domain-containing protein n=1 Tax=Seiridium cardinale TaxID=138064 RepID=A0ABR2XTC9_9PEZI
MAQISLDRTLQDLYALDNDEGINVSLVYAVPIAEVQMCQGITLPTKYTYQSPLLPTNDADELAREFLQLVPQLFGFIAGPMPVNIFDLDRLPSELNVPVDARPHRLDAHGVFERLKPSQRPSVNFVTKAEDVICEPGTRVALINPTDSMDNLPQLVSPENHYQVLSKRTLAVSGLPTPKSTVLDVDLTPDQLSDAGVANDQVHRILDAVRDRALPFVAKLPQSLSGQGTFLVRSEAERSIALKVLRREVYRMLAHISPENQHLRPCSLILQDIVPGEAVALSFFVTQKGRVVFNACCRQLVDAEGNWGGAAIDYLAQDDLAKRYKTVMFKIAEFLHFNKYWGPAGADIMTNNEGEQLVIDMNVRVTGSHPLGALRTFFEERGLHVATLLFPFLVRGAKAEFEEAFDEELSQGGLVVLAWVRRRDGKSAMATVAIAAPEHIALGKFLARIKQWEISENNGNKAVL